MEDYFSKHDALNLIKEAWIDEPPARLVEQIEAKSHVLPSLTIKQLYELSAEGEQRYKDKVPLDIKTRRSAV